jgi:hypothetical protein
MHFTDCMLAVLLHGKVAMINESCGHFCSSAAQWISSEQICACSACCAFHWCRKFADIFRVTDAQVVQHLEIPTWAVYIASVFTFGAGLLGISYGALSASWSTAEGSMLGVDEFKKNLPFALDRMRGK